MGKQFALAPLQSWSTHEVKERAVLATGRIMTEDVRLGAKQLQRSLQGTVAEWILGIAETRG